LRDVLKATRSQPLFQPVCYSADVPVTFIGRQGPASPSPPQSPIAWRFGVTGIDLLRREESNNEDGMGLIHSAQSVYTEYPAHRRDDWESVIRPALNKVQQERVAEMKV
jgi:hypothetical protein